MLFEICISILIFSLIPLTVKLTNANAFTIGFFRLLVASILVSIFLNKKINFKAYIRDLSIPHEFLADHASEPRYCAVSKAILAVIDLDTSRDPQKESVLGPGMLLRLGHLALFAVDQEEYTAGYRAIIRSRAFSD